MELTRRNFIVGAGVAAGASALAGLAGCSSQGSTSSSASATETKEASKAAEGARWSWDVKPDLPSDDEIVETYDCDICVCGLGVAGPLAMYYAMQKRLQRCRIAETRMHAQWRRRLRRVQHQRPRKVGARRRLRLLEGNARARRFNVWSCKS